MRNVGYKSQFDIALGIKRMIILTGNIHDWQLEEDEFSNELRPYTLNQWIVKRANQKGALTNTYKYNIMDGVKKINPVDSTENNKIVVEQPDAEKIMNDLHEVHYLIRNQAENNLVIIEHADKLFAHNQTQQLDEKQIAVSMIKLSHDDDANLEINENNNISVLIYERSDLIPQDLFKGNPDVQIIHIPLPSNEDRKQFFQHNQASFEKFFNDARKIEEHEFVGRTFDFTNKELFQIYKLFMQKEHFLGAQLENMLFEDLINDFRFGRQENPWQTILNAQKLDITQFKEDFKIHGQDRALEKIVKLLKSIKANITNVDKRKPRGVLFLCGPTGSGKTMLCKEISKFIFGTEDACKIFAMGEYKGEGSVKRLTGADPSFVGYEQGGQLTNFVHEHPFSIIVLDEAEKAHPEFWDIFLNILEEGKCTDGKGKVAYFNQTLIVFTSNIGLRSDKDFKGNMSDFVNNLKTKPESYVEQYFIDKVEEYFENERGRPELLGRIGKGNIVPFTFLKEDFIKQICMDKLENLSTNAKKNNPTFTVEIDYDAVSQFIYNVNKENFYKKGARCMEDYIHEVLVPLLAEDIIGKTGGKLNVKIAKNEQGNDTICVEHSEK